METEILRFHFVLVTKLHQGRSQSSLAMPASWCLLQYLLLVEQTYIFSLSMKQHLAHLYQHFYVCGKERRREDTFITKTIFIKFYL